MLFKRLSPEQHQRQRLDEIVAVLVVPAIPHKVVVDYEFAYLLKCYFEVVESHKKIYVIPLILCSVVSQRFCNYLS